MGRSRGEEVEHVFHPDPKASETGTAAALGWADGNAVQFAHDGGFRGSSPVIDPDYGLRAKAAPSIRRARLSERDCVLSSS